MSLNKYNGSIKTFDILYLDKTDGELKIDYRYFLPENRKNYEVLGICVIPSGHTLDGYARFIGFQYDFFAMRNFEQRKPVLISDLNGEENTKNFSFTKDWMDTLPCHDRISWYIPSIGELRHLLPNIEAINEVLGEIKLKKYSLKAKIVASSSVSKESYKLSGYQHDYFYKISMRNPFRTRKDEIGYPTDMIIPFCKV